MVDYSLPASTLAELRAAHCATCDKREADRIKAVILLASGWRTEDIADALLIDPDTVRNHFRRYGQAVGLRSCILVELRVQWSRTP